MKRLFLIVLSTSIPIFLPAQERIQKSSNMFRPSDTVLKQQVEYKHPGIKGEDVFWDFGKLKTIDSQYSVRYNHLTSDTSTIVGIEHQTRYYYTLRGDSLLLMGYENPNIKMKYSKPELLLRYPMALGDSIQCCYGGSGRFCDKLDITSFGSSKSIVDGYGMLILPNTDTLRHVVRVHTVKLISEKINATDVRDTLKNLASIYSLSPISIQNRIDSDSVVLVMDTYRWYAAGYRYPVFETVTTGNLRDKGKTSYFSTAFYYPPKSHDYLTSDEINKKIQERLEKDNQAYKEKQKNKGGHHSIMDEMKFRYNYYPNPVQTSLTFEYYLSKSAELLFELYTLDGVLVYHTKPEKTQQGAHLQQIDMSRYPVGTYILSIRTNGETYSEKIIKK